MAIKAISKVIILLREALNREIMINRVLIALLVAKGIIIREEVMTKIGSIRRETPNVNY